MFDQEMTYLSNWDQSSVQGKSSLEVPLVKPNHTADN